VIARIAVAGMTPAGDRFRDDSNHAERSSTCIRSGHRRSGLDGRRVYVRHRDRPADLGAGEPRGDLPVRERVDAEQDRPSIGHRSGGSDEACVAQQMQLTGGRRATEPELLGQARRASGSERDGSHEPPPGRIGEQVDPGTVSPCHAAPFLRPAGGRILACPDWLAINRGEPRADQAPRSPSSRDISPIVPLDRNDRGIDFLRDLGGRDG